MTKLKYLLCLFSFFCLTHICGQQVITSVSIDTLANEVTSFVFLIDIPQGGRARFQQRLPAQAKLIAPPLEFLMWDTNNNIFTIVSGTYPKIDTLFFKFTCKVDYFPDNITWGESAFMYEDKNKQVQKINIPAKTYSVREDVKDSVSIQKGMFYIQISASKSPQKITDLEKQIHLQKEHILIERKTDKHYTYLIGHFPTRAAASEKLKDYKKHISDAFVVTF